ncbi:hypothetical protein KL932_004698 [Ogataea haglerorum]|uniref:Major facilitator superfamily (MFS) profile domain-containing protein n=1 Tax=Ogataea haglerorum TaxID=1937702 RepID=A0ABQ7RAD3_9ASCO|nr:hypothetical protein KL950_004413 [Ogataea haglerorum]KAG7735251.1 hypothetical protein KL932_004698 [Ogataea haglerorum]KAG7756843.1 hypothetical protein KL947_003563 [Ogataea haglerorum]KAG7762169.1 hypothetical protein KL946_004816 [Ogataea haglerorum]KAG7805431.1 hypothetical protein KL924_004848 [Ogataea haglerorum]
MSDTAADIHKPKTGDNHVEIEELIRDEEQVRVKHWYDAFIRLFYWYPRHVYSPKERKFLVKLDLCLLIYTCVSYFTKALDKANITNAYVSGMEEDIKFYGNDLSYAKSLYSAGYIVSMAVGTLLVTQKWSRFLLPSFELIWGVLTFCGAAATKPQHIFCLRFLIGFCEGIAFPSSVYIIGSWFTRDEVFRRVMVFSVSSSLGGMFSGYLQSAAYENLSGTGGLAGWKWGFIIDGIFTVPVAIFGLFMFPGPLQAKSQKDTKPIWWMTKDEYEIAVERQVRSGIDGARQYDFKIIKKTVFHWPVHFFATFWVLLNIVALPDGTVMPLWLKYEAKVHNRFTVSQINNYPTLQAVVGVVAQFFLAGLSDSFPIYPFLAFTQICFIIAYASLAAWNIAWGWKWVCMLAIGLDSVNQAIVSGWINRVCRHDSRERAFVIGYSDAVSQAMNIWTNIVFYPTSHAPEFRLGLIVSTVAAALMLVLPAVEVYLTKRDTKKYVEEKQRELVDRISVSSNEKGAGL